MKYRRYGKFHLRDYTSAWLVIVFLFVLVVVGFLTDTQFYLLICPLLLALIMLWSILGTISERFSLSDNIITVIKGKKKISIPDEATVVVSYADVCSSLSKRVVGFGNNTYMLKDRYAISILQKTPLEAVLERLHPKYAYRYTNTEIEVLFAEQLFVYSFVGNQELFDKLVANKKYQIIIPETLLNQISTDLHQINVYIDTGY